MFSFNLKADNKIEIYYSNYMNAYKIYVNVLADPEQPLERKEAARIQYQKYYESYKAALAKLNEKEKFSFNLTHRPAHQVYKAPVPAIKKKTGFFESIVSWFKRAIGISSTPEYVEGIIGAKSGLIVRTGPDSTYKRIKFLAPGTKVKIIGKENGWFKILFSNGVIGYIPGKLTSSADNKVSGNAYDPDIVGNDFNEDLFKAGYDDVFKNEAVFRKGFQGWENGQLVKVYEKDGKYYKMKMKIKEFLDGRFQLTSDEEISKSDYLAYIKKLGKKLDGKANTKEGCTTYCNFLLGRMSQAYGYESLYCPTGKVELVPSRIRDYCRDPQTGGKLWKEVTPEQAYKMRQKGAFVALVDSGHVGTLAKTDDWDGNPSNLNIFDGGWLEPGVRKLKVDFNYKKTSFFVRRTAYEKVF